MLDVCSIIVTLFYTKYRAYDHLVMPIRYRNQGPEALDRGAVKEPEAGIHRVPHAS